MNKIKLFSDINARTTDLFRRADDTQPLYIALDSVGGSVINANATSQFAPLLSALNQSAGGAPITSPDIVTGKQIGRAHV